MIEISRRKAKPRFVRRGMQVATGGDEKVSAVVVHWYVARRDLNEFAAIDSGVRLDNVKREVKILTFCSSDSG